MSMEPSVAALQLALEIAMPGRAGEGDHVADVLHAGDVHDEALEAETEALLALAPTLPGRLLLVSNEVGWGIVPMQPLSRLPTVICRICLSRARRNA